MKRINMTQRKWLVTIHLLFSAIMLGMSFVFLVLSIVAGTTNDEGVFKACYSIMHLLSKTTIRFSTIGTLVTGILLSVLTPWGLFKHYWIIVKEAVTFLTILIGPVGMYMWTLKAVTLTSSEGMNALLDQGFTIDSMQLWIGIILQIVSLVGLFIISVFKPWGTRKQQLK